jgi:hypothetical protein
MAAEYDGAVGQYEFEVDSTPSTQYEVAAIDASISINSTFSQTGCGHATTLKQDYYFWITLNNSLPIRQIVAIVQNLELFVSLLTGGPSLIQSIKLHARDERAFTRPDIHLLYNRAWRRGGRRYFARDDMPATFQELEGQLGQVFDKWFAACEKYSPVMKLLAASLFQPGPFFIDNRFLTVAQAVEGYCRISNVEKYLPRDEFRRISEAMKKCIPDECHENFRTLADIRIRNMNDFSLRDHVLSLFKRHSWLKWLLLVDKNREPTDDDVQAFVSDVTRARNNLTHVEAGRANAKSVSFGTFWRLRAILCALFLAEAGVHVEQRCRELQTRGFYIAWWMDEAYENYA